MAAIKEGAAAVGAGARSAAVSAAAAGIASAVQAGVESRVAEVTRALLSMNATDFARCAEGEI